jgi:acyl-CoA reductase-like NAD-dependent aldehyde dehydrogenase
MNAGKPLIRDNAIHGTAPADGAPLEPVTCTRAEDLPSIVARARVAADAFARTTIAERAQMIVRFGEAVLARRDTLRDLVVLETGKPEAEAWLHEIGPTTDLAAYWSKVGPSLLANEPVHFDPVSYPGKKAVIERVPRGVLGLITPWNFPMAIPLRALFPALLAGNAVVWKPSEFTARIAEPIAHAALEVFGPHIVTLVQGGGDVGAALVSSGVDSIIFTGSVRTGRLVARAAAEALIPASLELGGKDPAIVLDDADLDRAARGIVWGALVNAGQNCASVERVYVTRRNAGPLAERIVAIVRELKPERDFGPLVTEAQLAIVERHVASAKKNGAKVLFGGERLARPGNWYAPTVLTDVPAKDESVVEETFGPVLPLLVVESEEAAIAAANDSRFGLTASVWTRDLDRGAQIARRLRAGVVMVNNHGFTGAVPALPWSGVGESGSGVTNSPHTLDAMTRPRAVVIDASKSDREMWWHPYGEGLVAVGTSLATLRSGASVPEKAHAVKALAKGFLTRWKS